MKYRQLGRTNIQVSSICLGSMNWGDQNTEKEGHAQLDCAVEYGVNFIDTAEMYPIPPKPETYGRTEEIIGTWLKQRSDRDKLIIASKIAPPGKNRPYIRGDTNKLDERNIRMAVDASLKRLQTDYIDLYQVHWPERHANNFGQLNYTHAPARDGTPIAATLEALENMVRAGKIRHIGISNETPWGMFQYLNIAEQRSLSRIVSIQNPYNLLNRLFEIYMSEIALREQVGLLAYSPLGFGVLTGKYLDNQRPKGARLTENDGYKRYRSQTATVMAGKYVQLARDYGLEPAQMALAFILTRPFLASVIIGTSTVEQVRSNIASIDVKLPDEVLKKIDSLNFEQPSPCP
jgi:aryl-alcohol dehydrogenase-like predicted oxidoreductase